MHNTLELFKKINVKNIKSKKDTFIFAQICFVLSITLGWYIQDGYRRALFILALFLTDRSHFNTQIISKWRGLTKVSGILLLSFLAWIVIMPLLGGVDPLGSRISSIARPLEVLLWTWGVMIYAKDKFFVKCYMISSILSGTILVFLILLLRVSTSFAPAYGEWGLRMYAALGGLTVTVVSSWFFLLFFHSSSNIIMISVAGLLLLAGSAAVLSSYYLTAWLAFIAEAILSIPFGLWIYKNKKVLPILLAMILITFSCFGLAYTKIPEVKMNIDQLFMIDKDLNQFSSQRIEIWEEAISLISARKFTGYGWIDYDDIAKIKKHHAHSSYLQVAFISGWPGLVLYVASLTSLSLLAASNLLRRRGPSELAFVALLVIAGSSVAGLTESFFFIRREFIIPYWTLLCCLLSPVYTSRIMEK